MLLGGGNKPFRTCGLNYVCVRDHWEFWSLEDDVMNQCFGALLLAVLVSEHISHRL